MKRGHCHRESHGDRHHHESHGDRHHHRGSHGGHPFHGLGIGHHSHHGWSFGHSGFEIVRNLKTPYVGSVPGGLSFGKALFFQGFVPLGAKGFEISLKTGKCAGADTAFVFNPRIGNKVALNSFRNGNWEKEETASVKPFFWGAPFILFIVIKAEGYEVYVNGIQHCLFKHRIPLEKVSTVEIRGDVSMNIFNFIENWSTSFLTESVTTTDSGISFPVSNPQIPYMGSISGGIRQGMALHFKGTVLQEAKHFEVILKTGQSDGDETAFNFKPSIGQSVSLSSFSQRSECVKTVSVNPFSKGTPFTMTFVMKPEGYEVYINGFRHSTFKHCIPLEKVSVLSIGGDVSMNNIDLIENWHTSSFFLSSFQTEMMQSVLKPAIPYVGPLSGGLKPGMALCFQGMVPEDAKEFEVNLKTGQSNNDDTAFHFKPYIGQKVALNSFRNGSWETEESASDKPFVKGAPFNMFFVVKPQCYEVYVNGLKHCVFKHRIPLEKVSAILVGGNVSMNILGLMENWQSSSFFLSNFQSEMVQPVLRPAIPYVGSLPGGLRPGMAMCFQGVVPANAKEFEINLKSGPSKEDDTAFHFKPNIGQRVTLNCFKNGSWESEESASDKPFTKGAPFNMFYVVKPEGYEVYVNGFQHCTFKHRIPLEKVSVLSIGGDVSMNLLGVIENWHTSSFFLSSFQTEMVQSALKPAIPYVGPLSGGLKPGMALCFQGMVPVDAKEFEVNLKTGQSNNDDTAFHFKPYIGQKVALNSFRNGSWETEESVSDKPFAKGAPFNMFFVVKPQCYEVYVNGLKHCIFKHRIPLEKVSALLVGGNVSMNILGLIENWQTSSFCLNNLRSEMMQPIFKPAIPYVGSLHEGLRPGMAMCFQGVVPANAKEFEINLKTGPSKDDDTAFHFKPCIGQRVTLNSFRNGSWESEESASDKPFTKGAPFNMFYVVKPEGYEVYLNGFQHCTFKHRIPLEKVSALSIGGDVSMNLLGVIKNWHTSSFFLSSFQTEMVQSVLKPAIPYVGPLSGGLKPGMALCFQGMVPVDAKEFEVNLKTGQSNNDDTAFHFKPYIGQKVALNSFRNGSWETEESASDKPFVKGAPFNMFFVVKPQCYEVYVNGLKHCTFKHRIPLEKVSALLVGGNVSMNILGFMENWQTSSFFLNNFQSEMVQPVLKPAIPYVGSLTGGLRPGMAMCFQGAVPVDAKEFEINLKTGPSKDDDTAFHFKPCIGQRVTLNSFRNGSWESEESASDKPFTKGAPFNMFYVVKPEGYEVYLNGFQHCTFKHRIPLEKVSALSIGGDVSMNLLGVIEKWHTSSFFLSNVQSEMTQPIFKPAIPYVGTIPVGIKPGTAVCLQGTVPENASRFAVNFKTGPSDGDDIALHFSPHIGEKVVLNSFRNGKWETEESAPDKPFTKGAPFNMFVVTNKEGYDVFVNGLKHCMFKHRIPVEKVSNLGIVGDVSMNILGYIDNWRSSPLFKEQQKVTTTWQSSLSSSPVQFEVSHPITNPAIPYVGVIPQKIKPDMAVCFQGTVPDNANQFALNFKTGPSDGDDIAFHFSPRIGEKVLLNSFRNGKWETEESAPDKPFTKGAPFNMFVAINKEGYEVFVNGLKHCMFKHRIPVEKVSNLGIAGDVSMNILGYIDNWSSFPLFKEQQKVTTTWLSSLISSPVQLELSRPVTNPAIPYLGAIPQNIKPDMAVCFQGTVPDNANQFAVNFKTGPSDGDDIAFHFNPHIGEKVVLNSCSNGKWETEESAPDKPFTKGAPFNMIFAINKESYEVFVNGLKHCMFKHRIPVEKVSNLGIAGDVSMNILGYIDNWRSSPIFKQLQKVTTTWQSSLSSSPVQFEVSHPITNPAIPYVGAIPQKIKPDMAVCFQGTVPDNANQFALNFKTGPSDGDDIAFHFSPRIGEKVLLNSFRNGKWETEESAPDKPFTKGAPFNMFVAINKEGYEVFVNGLKHCMFKHRIPVEKVSNLGIAGDVSMNILGYIDNWSSFPFFKEQQKVTTTWLSSLISSPVQLELSRPVTNPAIPYLGAIPQNIKPDMAVCFQGTVPDNAKQFAVNFKTGPSDGDDIAFHFSPHIGEKVVLNSCSNGKWETEESAPDKPFTKGAPFNMIFAINKESYEVFVNGVKHCMFKHRIPVEKVSNLGIAGDVSMNILGYIDNWRSSPIFKQLQKVTTTWQSSLSSSPVQFEVSHPITNPAIPYVGAIPQKIKPDMAVCFQGTVPDNANQFALNFKTGPSDGDDIAFHFSPRFGEKVLLNSFRNGKWETEESAPDKPFTKGAPFNMFVAINKEGYEVFVNGLKHCMFKHRIPVEKVSNLGIAGDVSMNILGYIDNWSSFPFFKEQQKVTTTWLSSLISSPVQLELSRPVTNPAIPYLGAIPQNIKPDMAVCFQGTVPDNANQFAVNFKTGPSDGDDIAFHFSPHIGEKVVLNSCSNGKWETEESAPDKPFTKGAPFNMIFAINKESYEVFVNGVKHCMFKHRIPVEKVSNLGIAGDVSMNILGYIDNWRSSPFYKQLQKVTTTWQSSLSSSPVQFEVSHPITNPAIPYVGAIPQKIKPDMAVCFQGTVPDNANQFALNFKTGPSDGDDIAFHFSPRIGEKVLLNSFRNGKWETEESAPDKPFTKGAPFNMFVAINKEGYEVFVNGLKHCMFKHRIPVEKVSNLGIAGDVSMNILGYIDNWSSFPFFKEQQKVTTTWLSSLISSPVQLELSRPVTNPAIPYLGAIPQNIKPDMAVCFQGTVPDNANQFAVNFKTGPSDGDDIAFHFNPHIGEKVVLNSCSNGKWETEESAPDKPFTKGAPFNMIFAINKEGYEVFVNGLKHCMFKHRIPVEKVSNLGIAGDVSMNILGFIDNWRSSPFFTELQKVTTTWQSSLSSSPVQFEVSHPVTNPAIPYVGAIPQKIKPDMAVCFQGTVPDNGNQFALNFKTGPSDGDDIAFHFSPRIGEKVLLNSFRNGKWETEESAPDKPFTKGAPFNMFVAINKEGYEVFVNGLKHCMFKHRIPVEKVSNLGIAGDVSMNILGYIDNWSSFPFFKEQQKVTTTWMSSLSSSPVQLELSRPVTNPAIPYLGAIPQNIKPDMAVCFQGTVPDNANQFAVNFKTGPSDGDDIAFHFSPRFGEKVLLNSFRNGKWETEESAPDKPFTKGAPFNMIFAINKEGYEVFVNGLKHCMFKHRIPVEKVSNLGIVGDVSMNILGYIDNWSSVSFFKEEQKVTSTQIITSGSSPVQFQMSNPVINPAIPHVGAIPEVMKPDMAVCFQGTVPDNASQFAINFKTGSSNQDGIAFHFKPCIGQKVVMNSFRNGKWETEESTTDNPFSKGASFLMFVAMNAEGYEVIVNGMEHSMFKHRIPVEKVSTIEIRGDVSMQSFGYIYNWSSYSFKQQQKVTITWRSSSSSSPIQLDLSHPAINPSIPYVGTIPALQNMAVVIQGTVPENTNEFSINFKTGQTNKDETAFHFNPRIGKALIMNSFQSGKWQKEEFASVKPFIKGAPFNVIVAMTAEGYEVNVNGTELGKFKHRIPLSKVSVLYICGNVSIQVLGYIANWNKSLFFPQQPK